MRVTCGGEDILGNATDDEMNESVMRNVLGRIQ
jgi:hypothetical protein